MKKGISLIVLVITIIVMIIIAGAIIISLNSTNIIEKANTAVDSSNESELKAAVALEYMNQYVAYWEAKEAGTEGVSAPNAASVKGTAESKTSITDMLANMNKNTSGVQYDVADTEDGGVEVTKTTNASGSQQ